MTWYDEYPWTSHADAMSDPSKLRTCFATIDSECSETEFQRALFYVDHASSDLGVPTSLAPPVVARLIASVLSLDGARRKLVLGEVEELTCGRYVETYTPAQVEWLLAARRELVLAYHLWLRLAVTGDAQEATECIDLVAYVGESFPDLRPRVLEFLHSCRASRPDLAAEVDAVTAYLVDP